LIHTLLQQGLTPVFCAVTHNGAGQLLNTNADTITQEIGKSLATRYHVELVYTFEKAGVLLDAEDETTVIPEINTITYKNLKANGTIFAGMIPKLDNAFAALDAGVRNVRIGNAQNIGALISGTSGTSIVHE
jgi:acetylglutamate kinase